MSLVLRQLFVFFRLLNSEKAQNQIAAGVVCGVILGFAPAISFQAVLVFVIIFLFRVQFGAAFATAFFVKLVAMPFDPLFDAVGRFVLERPTLEPIFTWMFNVPIIPWTRFYNTIVMGSAAISILLAPVVFVLTRIVVRRYRETIVSRFKDSKLWNLWKSTTLYKWYMRFDEYT